MFTDTRIQYISGANLEFFFEYAKFCENFLQNMILFFTFNFIIIHICILNEAPFRHVVKFRAENLEQTKKTFIFAASNQ